MLQLHVRRLRKLASDPSQKFSFLHKLRREEEETEETRRRILNGHSGDRNLYPGCVQVKSSGDCCVDCLLVHTHPYVRPSVAWARAGVRACVVAPTNRFCVCCLLCCCCCIV